VAIHFPLVRDSFYALQELCYARYVLIHLPSNCVNLQYILSQKFLYLMKVCVENVYNLIDEFKPQIATSAVDLDTDLAIQNILRGPVFSSMTMFTIAYVGLLTHFRNSLTHVTHYTIDIVSIPSLSQIVSLSWMQDK